MNAITYLTQEHRKVDELFTKLLDDNSQDNENLTKNLINALRIHATQEETYFYPKLLQRASTAKFVEHAEKEHGDVKNLLRQLEGSNIGSLDWHDNILMLKEAVTHHVEEEEGHMFPAVEAEFEEEILEDIGAAMEKIAVY